MLRIFAVAVFGLTVPTAHATAADWYAGGGGGLFLGKYVDEYGGNIPYWGGEISAFAGLVYPDHALSFEIGADAAISATASGFGFVDTNTGAVGRLTARAVVSAKDTTLRPYLAAGPTVVFQRHKPNIPQMPGEDTAAHFGMELAAGVSLTLPDNKFLRGEGRTALTAPATYDIGGGAFTASALGVSDVRLQLGVMF